MNFNMDIAAAGNGNKKIRIGAVSYLNSKPLIYGLENGMMQQEAELIIDYPSNIANALLDDSIDIGLVPVAIIPEMKEHHIITDYCIGCDGAVESVCLFSDVPVEEIKTVLLDYQSRTSILLAQFLLKEYWKKAPVFKKAETDFIQQIKGNTAAVVIGDRSFVQRKISKYCYDLGLAWKQHTGLPFVFAAWVSNKPMTGEFVKAFNAANEYGLKNLDAVVEKYKVGDIDLKEYYTRFIQYRLNEQKRQGLKKFLNWCSMRDKALSEIG
jgi:chorismate dehydratase